MNLSTTSLSEMQILTHDELKSCYDYIGVSSSTVAAAAAAAAAAVVVVVVVVAAAGTANGKDYITLLKLLS